MTAKTGHWMPDSLQGRAFRVPLLARADFQFLQLPVRK
jgi:hypothetical protein